jgi:tryptophan 7-halogenase
MTEAPHSAVRRLVIVGRDAPLWLSACVMHSALAPAGVRVTAVELPSAKSAADVYATLPALEPLHTRLGVDEGRLLAATRGAFTLGMQFHDTTGQTAAFFHAYGSAGARIDDTEFLPHWIKARCFGLSVSFEDFCLTAAAAKHGRMLIPDREIERHGFTDYGYHLPAIAYGAWLKQLALRRGVIAHEARDVRVLRKPGTADIAAVVPDDGNQVGGDFFIDATGDRALLLGGELGIPRESWRDSFPADRELVAHAAPVPSMPVYADVRAGASGWASLHPTQACTHVIHAYSSETPDDVAIANASRLARFDLQGAQVRARNPGRSILAWERNCVGIGEAACVFDAIHGVELQAVQLGLVHLLPLFPMEADFAVEREEYNRNLHAAFERIRDFQSAHYVLNGYGGDFWQRARLTPVSRELLRKIGVFRARGDVVHFEDESFSIADWQALLLGHGVKPETWDPAADRASPDVVKDELRRILRFIRQKVDAQCSHSEYLQGLCRPRGERDARTPQ